MDLINTPQMAAAADLRASREVEVHLQCSFKIGKVLYDVTLTESRLSWVKKGDAVEKAGTGKAVKTDIV